MEDFVHFTYEMLTLEMGSLIKCTASADSQIDRTALSLLQNVEFLKLQIVFLNEFRSILKQKLFYFYVFS